MGSSQNSTCKNKNIQFANNNLFHKENRNKRNCRKTRSYSINLSGNPVSCLIKKGKCKMMALVDSGAEVSLLHKRFMILCPINLGKIKNII
jgi:hypothetical protein